MGGSGERERGGVEGWESGERERERGRSEGVGVGREREREGGEKGERGQMRGRENQISLHSQKINRAYFRSFPSLILQQTAC